MIYTTYLHCEMSNNLLCQCMQVLYRDVLTSDLRGEGRRDWDADVRYGVKKNHMIHWNRLN